MGWASFRGTGELQGRQVEHLLAAHQRGLGKIDVEKLKITKGAV
jgi:hypothetical protein